jgi:hypothetical protein
MYCCISNVRGHAMGTNDTNNWSDLLDVVLFEADRVTLGERMERATDEIHRRMEELLKDEHAGSISERVALRNALTTLADLEKIAYGRKPSGRVSREGSQAIGS